MAGKVMTKAQLVTLIADKAELTKATASQVLELLASTAVGETKKRGQFVIPGIGKLVKSNRKARMDGILRPAPQLRYRQKRL